MLSIVILGVLPFLVSNLAVAQNTFPSSGNVGIGTTAPLSPLSVGGQVVIGSPYRGDASLHIMQSYGGFGRFIQINASGNSQSALNLMSDTNSSGDNEWWAWGVSNNRWTMQPGISFGGSTGFFVNPSGDITVANSYSKTDTTLRGLAQFQSNDISNPSYLAFYATGGASQTMRSITLQTAETNIVNAGNLNLQAYGGNVGIGTTNPQHLLSVNGTIQAKEVLVNTGWADYVFQPDYRVRSLTEVAKFIKMNHRLPDIPSETEVKDKGVSLGEMQTKLLAKIEELTLQMIQLDEKNKELDKKNNALSKRVVQLEGH